MEDIAGHILDIAENSLRADADSITITIAVDCRDKTLRIVIEDNGQGLSKEQIDQIRDPFFTTRRERNVGLGVPLFHQACIEAGGSLELTSEPGKGTALRACMPLHHIDRKPLGKIGDTLIALLLAEKQARISICLTKKNSESWTYEWNSDDPAMSERDPVHTDYAFLSNLAEEINYRARLLDT